MRIFLVIVLLLGSCTRPEHIESFGYMLENDYPDGIPQSQQAPIADGIITPEEVEEAVVRSLECMDQIDGVSIEDSFHWREDGIEFGAGAIPDPGADESVVVPLMDECYFEQAALVETAWFDQEYYGSFTFENKIN